MGSDAFVFSPAAYGKVFLHAFKFPAQAVSGLLVGKASGKGLYIHDAIPLFHTYLQLLPMFEVALAQVNAIFKEEGFTVVGYYSSPQYLDDKPSITAHTEKAIKKILEGAPSGTTGLAVQLLNSKFTPDCKEIPFKFYNTPELKAGRTAESGCFKFGYLLDGEPAEVSDNESVHERLRDILKQQKFTLVADFESHLDNGSNDYMNPSLNTLLSEGIVPKQ